MLAGFDQVRLRDVQLVRDNLQVALELLVNFVFFRQLLGQRFVGLLHRRLRGLFDIVGVAQSTPTNPKTQQRYTG